MPTSKMQTVMHCRGGFRGVGGGGLLEITGPPSLAQLYSKVNFIQAWWFEKHEVPIPFWGGI